MSQSFQNRFMHVAGWMVLLLLASVLSYEKRLFNQSSSPGVSVVQYHYRFGHPTWLQTYDLTVTVPVPVTVTVGTASSTQTISSSFFPTNLIISVAAIMVLAWLLSLVSLAAVTSSKPPAEPKRN